MERRLFVTAYVARFRVTKKAANEMYNAVKRNTAYVQMVIGNR